MKIGMKIGIISLYIATLSCSCQTMKQSTEPILFTPGIAIETNTIEIKGSAVIVDGFKRLLLVDEVNDASVKPLIEELSDNEGLKGFILEINSGGGSVDAGFLLARAIEQAGVPVHCFVDGDGASMAYYILQSCNTRAMTKRSVLMIHGPSVNTGSCDGNAYKWLEMGERLEATQNAMIEHCVAKMKIGPAELKHKILTRAWWMNWDEAIIVGATDSTVKNFEEVLAKAKDFKG